MRLHYNGDNGDILLKDDDRLSNHNLYIKGTETIRPIHLFVNGRIKLFIVFGNTKYYLIVNCTNTILDIKSRLFTILNIPVEMQRLFLKAGRELRDEEKLHYLNVKSRSTHFQMLETLPGQGLNDSAAATSSFSEKYVFL
jgi:hypothetical protein